MDTQLIMGRERQRTILSIVILLGLAIASAEGTANSAVTESDRAISTSTKVKHLEPTDDEIRFEFNPAGPFADLTEYYSVFIVIKQNGDARALRYGLRFQAKNVAAYEGVFPKAEIHRLFRRARGAFRLPKYRKDYDPRRVYHGDSFYLAVMSDQGNVKELLGNLETRPEDVRGLVPEMSELWKKLSEVPPAYAYLTRRPVENDRLRLFKKQGPLRLTPIESLQAELQSLLIPVVTQPRTFHPLTQEQYDQIKTLKRPLTYKGKGYELSLFLSVG